MPHAMDRVISITRADNDVIEGHGDHKSEVVEVDSHLVGFEGPTNPYQPLNWSLRKKILTMLLYGLTAMGASFASAIYSSGTDQVSHEFHISAEVATLGTSLWLFGAGLGPLFWAPLSELYGRKPAVLLPTFVSITFAFAGGAAKDVQTLMICRFFQGFFGSAPITNTGGVLGDIFTAEKRSAGIAGYSLAVVGGPTLGPIVGGAICDSYLRWRWTQYITGILQSAILVPSVLLLEESYPPALLVAKARKLRHETGDWALHAKHEEWDVSLKEIVHKYLVRPFMLLSTPICFCLATYASFVYGIFYASLGAFPYAFQTVRGWNKLVGSLPFLAMMVGILLALGVNMLNQKYYIGRVKANHGRPVPEARLPPMMLGSVVFVIGMFIFAWTSTHVFWFVPCIGIVCIGLGDAAHPTSRHLGQGANQGLEDCYYLADLLPDASNTELGSAFRQFASSRQPRTTSLVRGARSKGEQRVKSGEECGPRNQTLRDSWAVSDEQIWERFDALFKGRPFETAEEGG